MNTLLPLGVSAKDYFVNHLNGFHKFKSSVVIVVIVFLVYEINSYFTYSLIPILLLFR